MQSIWSIIDEPPVCIVLSLFLQIYSSILYIIHVNLSHPFQASMHCGGGGLFEPPLQSKGLPIQSAIILLDTKNAS